MLPGLGNPEHLPDSSQLAIRSGVKQINMSTIDDH